MSDPRVQGIIEFILKEKGLLDASARLRQLEAEVKQTSGSMVNLGRAGEFVGSALRTYLAPAAVFGFVVAATRDWMTFEKQLRAAAEAMKSFGIETETAMPRVERFLAQIAQSTGVVDDETLPAFTRFLNLTRDLDAALGAVSLAVAVSRQQVTDLASAADIVADLFGNRWAQAARRLGIDMQGLGETAADQARVVEILQERLKGYLEEQEKATGGVARLKAEWDTLGDEAGKLGKMILDFLVMPITVLVNWTGKLAQVTRAASLVLTDLWRGVLGGDIADSGKRLAAIFDETARGAEDVAENVNKFKSAMAGRSIMSDLEEASKKLEEVIKKSQKAAEEEQAAAEKAARARERQLRAAEQAEVDLLRSRRELAREGSAERLGLTLQVLEEEMALELAGTEKTEREKAAIRARYANSRMAAERDFLEGIYDQLMAGLEKEAEILEARKEAAEQAQDEIREIRAQDADRALDELMKYGELMTEERTRQALAAVEEVRAIEEEAALEEYRRDLAGAISRGETTSAITIRYLKRIEDAERASAVATTKIAQSAALTKIYWAQYAAQMFRLIGGLAFGENKKFNAAMALIDGILAGMESFKLMGGPANPAAWAALALGIATGVAQAAAIMKTQPGETSAGGGRGGGGASGAGSIAPRGAPTGTGAQPSGGAQQANANASQQTVVHDNSVGQVIHVHGAYIDSDSLRGLSRQLKQVERNDQARFQR